MAEEYTRVGPLRNPHSLKEVQPVSPYPRIDPQQQHSNDQQGNRQAPSKDEGLQVRRRFIAMRRLVEQLKASRSLQRVNFQTADRELRLAGWQLAEAELRDLLHQLKFPLRNIDLLFRELAGNPTLSNLVAGKRLAAEDRLILPESPAGLSEYNLVFQPLPLHAESINSQLSQKVEAEGRYIHSTDRLRLSFRPADLLRGDTLELTISALVGAVEIDQAGRRRAILYPRPQEGFGLYADKQINLSI